MYFITFMRMDIYYPLSASCTNSGIILWPIIANNSWLEPS
uniref:Uncharacterized protein n=1 Tax=Rhizophora mucronata TaxID=61149 RepID=A0A2P2MD74_RHIMU